MAIHGAGATTVTLKRHERSLIYKKRLFALCSLLLKNFATPKIGQRCSHLVVFEKRDGHEIRLSRYSY